MKIVHLFWSFTTGGAELMAIDIMNEQVKVNNVSINLIVINDIFEPKLLKKLDKRISVKLIKRKPSIYSSVLGWFYLRIILFLGRYDVIHCHSLTLSKVLKYLEHKTYLTVHDVKFFQNIKKNKKFIAKDLLMRYEKIFAISKSVQTTLRINYNLDSVLIYNGIPINSIKKRTCYDYDVFNVVQISRLMHKKKGQHILIEALSILISKGYTNVSLDLIGNGDSLGYLMQKIETLNLSKHVNFLGNLSRNEIYNKLSSYCLLVQPSIFEGFGLTVVEGMAAEIPVLVSNIEGPMEIINNGEFGYYFNVEDGKDCAAKIIYLMNNYSSITRKNKQQLIQKHLYENFDIKKTSLEYLKQY